MRCAAVAVFFAVVVAVGCSTGSTVHLFRNGTCVSAYSKGVLSPLVVGLIFAAVAVKLGFVAFRASRACYDCDAYHRSGGENGDSTVVGRVSLTVCVAALIVSIVTVAVAVGCGQPWEVHFMLACAAAVCPFVACCVHV